MQNRIIRCVHECVLTCKNAKTPCAPQTGSKTTGSLHGRRNESVTVCAQGLNAELHAAEPVSPDQVEVGLKQSGAVSDVLADAQHAQTPQGESKQKKMAKCCCCVIM